MRKILTISIAAYNVEKYLDRTISSLLVDHDTLHKMEVFIVNDGSSDSTLEIARKYSKLYPDVFYVIDKENGGYGSTVNASLARAEGKYFRLLDSDDYYAAENIAEFVSYLEKEDADIVFTPYEKIFVNSSKRKTINSYEIPCKKKINIDEIDSNMISDIKMYELTVKTHLIKNKIKICEKCFYTDTEFVFRSLLYADTIIKYDLLIYKYCLGMNGQSVSISGRIRHYKDLEKVLNRLMAEYCKNKDKLSDVKKNILSEIFRNTMEFYLSTLTLRDRIRGRRLRLKKGKLNIRGGCPENYSMPEKIRRLVRILRINLKMKYYSIYFRVI